MNIDSCQFFSHWNIRVTVLLFAAELLKVRTICIFSDFWERTAASFKMHECGSSGRKNVLRKLLHIPYRRLKAGFSVCWLCSTVCLFVTERVLTKTAEWNVQGVKVCFSKSLFTCVWFSFFVTWKLLGLGTTNVKGKTDHPVSLRWYKEFWTFPKRRVFFWLFIRFNCELISPSFAGLNLNPLFLLLLVSTFSHAQIYSLCRTSFILLFSKNHFVFRKTFSEIEGQ